MLPNLNHKYIKEKVRDRTDVIKFKMIMRQGIDHYVEIEIHHTEVEEDSVRITHKII